MGMAADHRTHPALPLPRQQLAGLLGIALGILLRVAAREAPAPARASAARRREDWRAHERERATLGGGGRGNRGARDPGAGAGRAHRARAATRCCCIGADRGLEQRLVPEAGFELVTPARRHR